MPMLDAGVIDKAMRNARPGLWWRDRDDWLKGVGATEKQIRRFRQSSKRISLSECVARKVEMLARTKDRELHPVLLKIIEAKYEK